MVKENDEKKTTNILAPDYEFYSFDKSIGFSKANSNDFSSILSMGRERKNTAPVFALRKREQFDYFNQYNLDTLKKIYAERYFVDHKKRSVVMNMIDFDGFIVDEDKTLIVEIKEKSPIMDKKNDAINVPKIRMMYTLLLSILNSETIPLGANKVLKVKTPNKAVKSIWRIKK